MELKKAVELGARTEEVHDDLGAVHDSLGESAASVLELAVGGSLVSPIVRAKARTK